MKKTLKTIGENLLAVLFLLLIVFWGCGCNEAKKIQKAEQRVKLNPQSFNAVGKAWAALNFQPPEVLPPVILKGKTEYVNIEKIVTLPVFDSISYAAAIDTLKKQYQGKCNEAVDKAFKAGANAMLKELKEKDVLHTLPDTTVFTTVDKKYIQFLIDSINSEKQKTARLQGVNQQLEQNVSKSDKRALTLLFWLLGVAVVVIVYIILRIKRIVP